MNLVSGYYDDEHVYLVERVGATRQLRVRDAMWSLFVDCDGVDRYAVSASIPAWACRSRPRVEGSYIRVDCAASRGRTARQVRYRLRDELVRRWGKARVREADVDPLARYVADHPEVEVSKMTRVLYVDLEAQSPGMGIDDARSGRSRILSYAVADSEGFSTAEVLLADDPRRGSEIPVAETDAAEAGMLRRLMAVIRRYDVVVAWYGGGSRPGRGFDFDCLRNRAEALGIMPRDVFGFFGATWDAVCWLDQMEIYKKFGSAEGDEKSSNSLDHVARSRGIEGKVGFDAARVYEVWESGPAGRARVLEYNVQDVRIQVAIEAATSLVALTLGVARICRVLPVTENLRATRQSDGFLLGFAATNGYHWPSVWRDMDDEEKAPGAVVFEPRRTGLIPNVAIADFAALYPSIMRTWNIGPDTVLDAPLDGVPCSRAPTIDVWFRLDRDSLFCRALEHAIGNRKRYQAEAEKHAPGTPERALWESLDAGAKIVANSFYGVLLCQHWRYYDRRAGSAVTTTAQWLARTVAAEVDAAGDGFMVVGGDTDSVFIHTGSPAVTPRGSDELFTPTGTRLQELVAALNESWPSRVAALGCRRSFLRLDWEQNLARMVQVKKKMYAGTADMFKGTRPKKAWKHKVRGFASRRGDKIRSARTMQAEVLGMLIGSEDRPDLPEVPDAGDFAAIVADWRGRMVDGPLELDDIKITKAMRYTLEEYERGDYTGKGCSRCRHPMEPTSGPPNCPKCGAKRARKPVPEHARVARTMAGAGAKPLVGDRIPYVLVYDHAAKKTVPVHADEPGVVERADRAKYWRDTWAPSYGILAAVYPDHPWPDPERERADIHAAMRRVEKNSRAAREGLFAL